MSAMTRDDGDVGDLNKALRSEKNSNRWQYAAAYPVCIHKESYG